MSEQELADKLQTESNIDKIRRAVEKINSENEYIKPLDLDEMASYDSDYWSD